MSEQDETQSRIREIVQQQIESQSLTPEKVASISTLCDRLLLADPTGAAPFVQEMIDLSEQGAQAAARRSLDTVPWMAMGQALQESLPAPTQKL